MMHKKIKIIIHLYNILLISWMLELPAGDLKPLALPI